MAMQYPLELHVKFQGQNTPPLAYAHNELLINELHRLANKTLEILVLFIRGHSSCLTHKIKQYFPIEQYFLKAK